MRPDLPWNLGGIPSQARESARTAARREGLSVGEWLTRRILDGFGAEDDMSQTTVFKSPFGYGEQSLSGRRDTDEMLAHVARSEADATDAARRVEEQLRAVARRLEATERNQAENNRAMSRAATEINIATREQAQAFEQLDAHVVSLTARLDRVEQNTGANPLKEAVKGLHQGLSRLADQISQTANQSASQISQLAGNLEAVADRLAQVRQEADNISHNAEQRFAVLEERVHALEAATRTGAEALERALQSIEVQHSAHRDETAELGRREDANGLAVARLEESIKNLQAQANDPNLDRRLSSIEQALGEIAHGLNETRDAASTSLADSLAKLSQRFDAAESRHREELDALHAAVESAKSSPAAAAPQPATATGFADSHAAMPAFDPPPFAGLAAQSEFPSNPNSFAVPPAHDMAANFSADHSFAAGPGFAPETSSPDQDASSLSDSYLSAARRSARAAAEQAEAERRTHAFAGFNWGNQQSAAKEPARSGKARYWLMAAATLIAITIVTGAIISRNLLNPSASPAFMAPLFDNKSESIPAKPAVARPVSAPKKNETAPVANRIEQASATDAAAPMTQTRLTLPPLQPPSVKAAPVQPAPALTAAPAPAPAATAPHAALPAPAAPRAAAPAPAHPLPSLTKSAALSPLDKLSALASAGNSKAQLIIGLKYLDGDGVPVNEAGAAKWLERAAEQGEPVAQYRLGTLYERGRGVPADLTKALHWYETAAQQGNRKAMHNLAVAYAQGTGTKKDFVEAARWFSKAAALGLADSQFNLAVLYERGLGVTQSLIDAYKWYAIAAAQGDAESKTRMDALATQLSPEARAAGQKAADAFKPDTLDPRANVAPQQPDPARG